MPTTLVALAAALTLGIGYRLTGNAIHRWAVANLTAANELEKLGSGRKGGKLQGTAVICGGSVAGLLAARVCADHFNDVIIIDSDNDVLAARAAESLPRMPGGDVDPEAGRQPRARVMQSRMLHATQALNLRALDRLFDNFRAWLHTAGAIVSRLDQDFSLMDGTLVHQPKEFYPDGVPEAFTMSRTAYENLLRCLVARVPNVRFMKGTVSAVTPSPEDQGRISSVTYRGEDGKSTEVENAEVVVDCSGLSHSGLTWLKRAGYHPPTKQTYNPHMRYYTVEFTVDPTVMQKLCPTGFDKTTPVLLFTFNFLDKEQRIFGFMQIEHNRIQVPVGGWAFKDTLSTVADLRAYVESLHFTEPLPAWVFDVLDYLEGEPSKTVNWIVASPGPMYDIKYHEAKNLPSNFVAIGDASMKLNPVFGQGMTKAMIGAATLDACLRQASYAPGLSSGFAQDFFKRQHAKLATAWDGTRYIDYILDSTEPAQGETLRTGAALRWYLRQIDELELRDCRPVVWRKFEVFHWLAPPTVMMAPQIVARVVWHGLKKKLFGV